MAERPTHDPEASAEVLTALTDLRSTVEDLEQRLSKAYAARLDLYQRGQAAGLTQFQLAEAAGVTGVAVSKALTKAKAKAAAVS